MGRAARFAVPMSLLVGLALSAPASPAQNPLDLTAPGPVRLRFDDAGRSGYLDATGKVVIPAQFTNAADEFREGFAPVRLGPDDSGKWTYVHTSGRMLGAPRFDDAMAFSNGLASVRVGNKWGVIDTSGAFVVEPRFDGPPLFFSDNRARLKVDGKVGFIDTRGTVVIPAQFADAGRFSHGLAEVRVGRKSGLIDTTGRVVLEPRFDGLFPVSPELYAVRIGRESRLVDRAGRMIGPAFATIYWEGFSEGLAAVGLGDKYGFVDTAGTLVIPAEFDAPGRFSSGRARVRKDVWLRESPPKFWGFIDRRGTVAGRFHNAEPFAEGLAAVLIGGQWAYIDTNGTVAIAPQFVSARAFSQGVAHVTFADQSWGYIDRTGRVIWRSAPGTARPPVAAAATIIATSTDTSALAGSGPFVDRLARLVQRLETAEQRGELGVVAFGATPLLPAIVGADRRVRAYADSQPHDARLAVLAARLGRVRWVAEPVVFSAESRPSLDAYTAAFAPYVAYLARALAIVPNDAEVHYWMGRLYGMSFSWQRVLYGGADAPDTAAAFFRTRADSALHHGRRAVELAPRQVAYREALALYLLMAERPEEAAEVVRDLAGGRHPIHLLLTDWRLLAAPPAAVPNPTHARALAAMQQARGLDYADLRVRAYVVPLPAVDVEAFYRARWPGLQLFDAEGADLREAGARMLMQFFRLKGTTLEPARSKKDIQRLAESDRPADGFLLTVIEMAKATEELRSRLPVAVGDTFCILTFLNTRRVR